MALDKQDIAKIAHLARLDIEDGAMAQYAGELSRILGLVEQMNAVDTADVEPMAHPLHMAQRLRSDEPSEPTDQRERFQSIAPAVEDGLYLVPKVIE
jgi:aspartyl-tRNA(Asn)/glutamyl-tRNA(Gln) amidotransferase subunit C